MLLVLRLPRRASPATPSASASPGSAPGGRSSRQGFALGVFGAGNVGASVTKFIGPALIVAVPAAGYLGGVVPGGWRFVPFLYMVLLIVMAVVTWFVSPAPRHQARQRTAPMRPCCSPLKQMRVWRFSLYYVVVFGAYVALAAWLPKYYVDVYDHAAVAGRPADRAVHLPGLAAAARSAAGCRDRVGARRVMYWTFTIMLIASGILMMPYGYIVLTNPDGTTSEVLPWSVGVVLFTVLVFVMGCAMGIGKAAVYKHIPEYFPHDVGAVGGLVGSLGALGGFFLPLLFAYTTALDRACRSRPSSCSSSSPPIAMVWMHLTVHPDAAHGQPRAGQQVRARPAGRPGRCARIPSRARRRSAPPRRGRMADMSHSHRTQAPAAGVPTGSRAGTPRTPSTGTPAAPGRRCGSPPSP